ncbi:sensor histidine kinase [Saccharopolyspora cebuensis]|uniref:histidine kinase n=1 Tax=Saccharopolyspora cebuensis TaxID=418759 RepID=A0ABV4CE13_9PSEU
MRFLKSRRRWLSWWDGRIRSLLFDLAVAFLCIPTGDWGIPTDSVVGNAAQILVVLAAFLVRRRFPWVPIALLVPLSIVSDPGPAVFVAVYTMARYRGPSVQLWAAYAVAFGASMLGAKNLEPMDVVPVVLGLLLITAFPLLLGLWVFQRKQLLASLRERAEQAERERDLLAERAVTAERRRIAREMHDVVAHRCSVITLQAGALTMTAPDERTGEVAEVIRSTSATALTELRSMLQVLRDDGHEATGDLADDASAEGIASLVEDAAAAGADVRLTRPDPMPETSTEVGRAAYRVVQEALTNAGKHAPGAPVRVDITADDDVEVTVTNGPGRDDGTEAVPGSGYGLIGMRERVTLAGGALRAGRTEDGGYRVRAVFPALG